MPRITFLKNTNNDKKIEVLYNYSLAQHFKIIVPGGTVVKKPCASAGDARDVGLILGWGTSPGVGNGTPLHYSCLESPMDRGAWWAALHGITKSWSQLSMHTHTPALHLISSSYLSLAVFSPPYYLRVYSRR